MKPSGNIKSTHDFKPFSVELPPAISTESRIKYTGLERDNFTNYDYMHFRFYASSIGRFLTPDNIIPDVFNPQSWNLYSYVNGNPVNFNDPTGHQAVKEAKLPPPSGSVWETLPNSLHEEQKEDKDTEGEDKPQEGGNVLIEVLKITGLQSTSLVPLSMNNPVSETAAEITISAVQEQTKTWEGNEAAESAVKGLSGSGTLYKIFADIVVTTTEVAKENAIRAYIASKGGEALPLAEGIFESAGLSTAAGWSYVGVAGFAGYAVGSAINYALPKGTKEIIGDTVLGFLQTIGLYKDLEGN